MMYIDFSKLFHNSSKDLRGGGTVNIPPDRNDWPKAWRTVFYKEYPRFEKIQLAEHAPSADLFEVIRTRRSGRDFRKLPIDIETVGTLLKYSCGISSSREKMQSRAQPSGGGRFPLEVYPIVFRGSESLPAGLYHYNVKEHALDVLWQRYFSRDDIAGLFTYPWVQNASAAIVITGIFRRNQDKYGERGYRYMLLETGHIGQNIYLNSTALDLKCCALGGTRDEAIEKLIDIDGIHESVLYALALG